MLLLVGLAVGCLVPVYRHHRLEDRLEAAASALVGVPVTVHCQTAGQQFVDAGAELGFVRYGPDGVPELATLIKREQCSDLADYLGSDKASPSREQAIAVHILSHEARHMAGITDEAVAECGAVQRDARAAQLLGADPEQALRLARSVLDDRLPADVRRLPLRRLPAGGTARRGSACRALVRDHLTALPGPARVTGPTAGQEEVITHPTQPWRQPCRRGSMNVRR